MNKEPKAIASRPVWMLPLVTINLSTVAVIPTMHRQIWRLSNNNIALQNMKIFKGYVLCPFDKEFISTGLWTALFVGPLLLLVRKQVLSDCEALATLII